MKQNKNIPEGYKDSPLGIIPNEWNIKRLEEIATISSGGTPSRIQKEYWENGNIPWITTSLLNQPYVYKADEYITEKGLNNSAAKLLPPETLLIAMYGQGQTRGKVSKLMFEASTNQACAALLIKKENIDFIFYQLNRKYNDIRNLSNEGGQKNLSLELIKNIYIELAPLEEQKKVVAILSIWDEAIKKQTTLIEKLEVRKQGLMQQLLAGKKRLLGIDEKWEMVKAGKIFQNISMKGFENEPLLSANQEYGVIPRDSLDTRVTMPTGDTKSFKLVEIGDFVISLRSFQGGIEYSYYRGIVSPAYTVLKPKIKICKEFYRQYFKSSNFIGHLAIAVIGIRDGKQISFEDFCSIKIPQPSLREQKLIVEYLNVADKEIALAKLKLQSLKDEKKGLMQVLLTGKKRV